MRTRKRIIKHKPRNLKSFIKMECGVYLNKKNKVIVQWPGLGVLYGLEKRVFPNAIPFQTFCNWFEKTIQGFGNNKQAA